MKESDFKEAQPYLFGEDIAEKAKCKLEAAAALRKSVYPSSTKGKLGFWGSHLRKNWGQQGGRVNTYAPRKSKGPGNIKQQVRKDFKMTRNYRSFINSSCIKYNKLCQSYPQINTGGHTKTPFGSVDRPDGLVHQQHQTGWKAGPVFEQLGTDHTRLMGLAGHIRVPNRAKPDPMASKAHARDKMLPGGARENLTGGSRT